MVLSQHRYWSQSGNSSAAERSAANRIPCSVALITLVAVHNFLAISARLPVGVKRPYKRPSSTLLAPAGAFVPPAPNQIEDNGQYEYAMDDRRLWGARDRIRDLGDPIGDERRSRQQENAGNL